MISQITDDIYIGDKEDAERAEGLKRICVHENPIVLVSTDIHIPFVYCERASIEMLDLIYQTIESLLAQGDKVLVYCHMGIERSPLAVVWYLHKKYAMSIEEAYQIVLPRRKQAMDRRQWLPPIYQ